MAWYVFPEFVGPAWKIIFLVIARALEYQLAGVLKSEICFKSSIQSKCGNIFRAWRKRYGNMSSTWPAPWRMSLMIACKSTGKFSASMQNRRKLAKVSCWRNAKNRIRLRNDNQRTNLTNRVPWIALFFPLSVWTYSISSATLPYPIYQSVPLRYYCHHNSIEFQLVWRVTTL